jgi:hypothetical protein
VTAVRTVAHANKRGEAYTGYVIGRMGTQPLRAGIASKSRSGLVSVVTCVKPKRTGRNGESCKSRRSSQATACNKRCVMNAGDPECSKGGVKCPELLQTETALMAFGKSDHLIVLRDGRADRMGKGVTVMCIRQRQPLRDNVGLDYKRQTFLAEISTGYIVPSARVSMAEEPGAGKPHAGICAGGAG